MKHLLMAVMLVFVGAAMYAQGTPDGETPANEGVCDEVVFATPGLYGLCIAFCEAQDCVATLDPATGAVTFDPSCKPSNPKLLENYNRRATPDDPPMPCVNVVENECPCWTEAELDLVADGGVHGCNWCWPDCQDIWGWDAVTGMGEFVMVQFLSPSLASCWYLDQSGPSIYRWLYVEGAALVTTCMESIEAEQADRGCLP